MQNMIEDINGNMLSGSAQYQTGRQDGKACMMIGKGSRLGNSQRMTCTDCVRGEVLRWRFKGRMYCLEFPSARVVSPELKSLQADNEESESTNNSITNSRTIIRLVI